MLKGQEPIVDFTAEPERGRIFDAEDTARHAVSALKSALCSILILYARVNALGVDWRVDCFCFADNTAAKIISL